MDSSSNKNKVDDRQGENLQLLQQQQRQIKAPEERPYRRRIKPPPDKVHRVHPARFRRFVQRRTCCSMLLQPNVPPSGGSNYSDDATASTTTSATTNSLLQPLADAAAGDGDPATDAGCLDVAGKSMQEAYMAWCSSNDIPLSPGTMAELSFTEHPSNDQR